MIAPDILYVCGEPTGSYIDLISLFLFSLSSPFYVEGTLLTTSLRYQGLASYF
jgi:hypothetical protein